MCLHGLDQGRDGKMSKASGTASLDSGIQEFRLPSNLESTDNWNGPGIHNHVVRHYYCCSGTVTYIGGGGGIWLLCSEIILFLHRKL